MRFSLHFFHEQQKTAEFWRLSTATAPQMSNCAKAERKWKAEESIEWIAERQEICIFRQFESVLTIFRCFSKPFMCIHKCEHKLKAEKSVNLREICRKVVRVIEESVPVNVSSSENFQQ